MASEQLKIVLDMLASMPIGQNRSMEEMRAGMEAGLGNFALVEGTQILPVDAGGVPGEWTVTPKSKAPHTILYLHGGGYVMGSPRTHRSLVSKLADEAQAQVLSLDYRLAPEHPHPAAVEDAVAAYRWMLGKGIEPKNLAISGDSAGGGLTMATLVALQQQGLPMPACAAPISPWVDMTGDSETLVTRADMDPMIKGPGLIETGKTFLGGGNPKDPLASPVFADLAGLPPLLIQVGDAEVLLGDSQTLHARASAAGVDSTLEVWDDMVHVWHMWHTLLPEGAEAIEKIGAFMRKQWAQAPGFRLTKS